MNDRAVVRYVSMDGCNRDAAPDSFALLFVYTHSFVRSESRFLSLLALYSPVSELLYFKHPLLLTYPGAAVSQKL